MRIEVNIFRKRKIGTRVFHLWARNDKRNGTAVE